MKKKSLLMVACAYFLGISLHAEILAEYTFTGSNYKVVNRGDSNNHGTPVLTNSARIENLAVSDIRFSPGLDTRIAPLFGTAYNNTLGFARNEGSNQDGSFNATDQVFYFTVNVAVGFQIDLTSITYSALASKGSGPAATTTTHAIFVNPKNAASRGLVGNTDYVAIRGMIHSAIGNGGTTEGDSFSTGRAFMVPIDLSGAAYQGLTGTNVIAFRVYSNDRDFGFDNIILKGTVKMHP